MDQAMIVPRLFARTVTNRPEMVGGALGLLNTGNTFNAHTFVVATAGVIAAVASAGTSTCGLCLDASTLVTKPTPPDNLLGGKHFPISPVGERFLVSVTDSSGHVGQANSAPQLSDVTVGTSYGIIKLSNGNHALNVSNTSNLFFKVVEKPLNLSTDGIGPAQTAATYNPVVVVEVIAAAIQTL